MKVDVITRHAVANYGSILQALATQQLIEELGYECELIDYIRTDENYYNRERTLLARKENWKSNYLKREIYLILRVPESIIAGKYFERTRKKLLKLTKKYTSINDLIGDCPKADIYITGSDQVWGKTENEEYDSAYCLSFTNGKKMSYAASFGNVINDKRTNEFFSEYLSSYSSILVREDTAVKYLQGLGLNAMQVLDPTLIFGCEYWNQYIETINDKGYILIYQLHNDSKLDEIAKKIAIVEHKRLIRISATLHQILRNGRFKYLPTIGEFLGYINNADLMVTDSFHGTAFAINFQTQFIEILPNSNTEERNKSILRCFGLSERIVSSYEEYSKLNNPIDYKRVNKVLEEQRAFSIDLLKDNLKKAED